MRVEELKVVLSKVLLFEKTPCPFQRHFTVELPEPPKTPVVRRPWRPVQGPQPYSSPIYENKRLEDDSRTNSPSTQSVTNSPQVRPKNERPPTPSQSPSKTPRISLDPQNTESFNSHSPPHSPADPQQPTTPLRPLSPPSTIDLNNSPRPHTPATTVDLNDDSTHGSPTDSLQLEDISNPSSETIQGHCSNSRPGSPTSSRENLDNTNETEPVIKGLAPSLLNSSPALDTSTNTILEENEDISDVTTDSKTPKSRLQPAFHPLTLDPESQALKNCVRSTTAPPVLSFVTSPPSKRRLRSKSPLRILTTADSTESSSSVRSFHSIPSWHSPLDPPSPQSPRSSSASPTYPYPHEDIVLPKRTAHVREDSELAMPITPGAWESSNSDDESDPKSPEIERKEKDQVKGVKPSTSESNIRHRATTSSNSRRRQLSPLPAAAQFFSPSTAAVRQPPRRMQTARHIPTAIIQKTCEILLSPPSHLLHLMINIASKIAAGEWRGVLFSGYGEVAWDFEEDYAGGAYSPADDFGIPLPRSNLPRRGKQEAIEAGGSWEVD